MAKSAEPDSAWVRFCGSSYLRCGVCWHEVRACPMIEDLQHFKRWETPDME